MFAVQLPVQGDLVRVELPGTATGLYAEAVVSRAMAYQRVGKKITSTHGWARAIAASAVRAESSGGESAARERQTQREHLSRYRRQSQSCHAYTLGRVLDILAAGHTDAIDFRSVMGADRLSVSRHALGAILGHALDHASGCTVCVAADARQWTALLFQQDVPESALRDLYQALVDARVIPSTSLVQYDPDEDTF